MISFIAKYKVDEGYKDEDGVFYEDAIDFLQDKVLGFCCCGCPAYSVALVMRGLQFIKDRKDIKHHEEIQASEIETFGSLEVAYFFYYVMDKLELTEHSGSVPGWLSEKGEMVLNDMLSIKEELD